MANAGRDEERKLQALRAAIIIGIEDVAAGRVVDIPEGEEATFVAVLGQEE